MKQNKQRLIINFVMIVLSFFAFICGLSSCSSNKSINFPAVSYNKTTSRTSTTSKEEVELKVSSGNIKVALPISSECLRYLSLMYVGKISGIFNDTKSDTNGLNIKLDSLETYNVGLTMTLQPVDSEGLTNEEISVMSQSKTLPDIYLVKNMNYLSANKIAAANLNTSFLDFYLNVNTVYPTMFNNSLDDTNISSLPYYASVKMLFMNQRIWSESKVQNPYLLKESLAFNDIVALSKGINNPKNGTYAWMDLKLLSAFLPSGIKPYPRGYEYSDRKFNFDNGSFYSSISLLKKIAAESKTMETLGKDQITKLYGNNDPVKIGKVAFWLDESSAIENWASDPVNKVVRYPVPYVDKLTIPLSVVNIAVNSNSILLEDAVRFAAFISLDKNALLFRSRYKDPDGYIPPLNDKAIWDNLVTKQYRGSELYLYRDMMEMSYNVNEEEKAKISAIYDNLYNDVINPLIYKNKSANNIGKSLNVTANKLLEE